MDTARHTHAYTALAHTHAAHTDADSDPSQTQTPNLHPKTFHLETVNVILDFANGYIARAKSRAAHRCSAAAHRRNH